MIGVVGELSQAPLYQKNCHTVITVTKCGVKACAYTGGYIITVIIFLMTV
jgi:hypothetical protein